MNGSVNDFKLGQIYKFQELIKIDSKKLMIKDALAASEKTVRASGLVTLRAILNK
jgi:hypothetical protein